MSNPYAPPGEPASAPRPPASGPPQPPGPPAKAPGHHDHRLDPRITPPARRPPPDPQAALRAMRLVSRFGVLLLAGLLAMPLKLPWQAGSVVFLVAAVVVGVFALVAVVRSRARTAAVVAVSLGIGATCLVLLAEGVQLTQWRTTEGLQECRAEAVTIGAAEQCWTDYEQSVRERLGSAG